MAKNLIMVCGTCNGENVRRNADVAWNSELQKWEITAIFDSATCEDCDGETNIIEVEIDDGDAEKDME